MILRLLRRIEQSENNMVEGVARPSLLSKRQFFVSLADNMMKFRRRREDHTEAIIWYTQPTKRFGSQFSSQHWNCQAGIIKFQTNEIPVVTPDQPQRPTRYTQPEAPSNNPDDRILEKVKNAFNDNLWTQYNKVVPLRVITMRLMLYRKARMEAMPENAGKKIVKPSVFISEARNEYMVTPTTPLRSFFFSEKAYNEWLKNTHSNCTKIIKPPPDFHQLIKDPRVKIKGISPMNLMAINNKENWRFGEDEWTSIYDYSHLPQSVVQQLDKDIHDNKAWSDINREAISSGIFTMSYAERLEERFREYKTSILADFHLDAVAAAAKHYNVEEKG